jgi:hypothetical protein
MTQEEIAIKKAEFHERLEKIKRGELPPTKFTPLVYDDAYFEAMAIMDSEDFWRNH